MSRSTNNALREPSRKSTCHSADASLVRVAEVMSTDLVSYEEETPFATLMDFFSRDARPLVVIVREGRPTGLVSTASLAALSEPLTTTSLSAARPYSANSEYLLVTEDG